MRNVPVGYLVRTSLLAFALLLLVGCSSDGAYDGVRHLMREIHLSPKDPADKRLGIRLLRVEPDGAAVIAVAETNEVLRAMPGEPFLGRYEKVHGRDVRTF